MKTKQIRRVLAPIDFSNASLTSLQVAIAICKRQLSTLTLIHVVEPDYAGGRELYGMACVGLSVDLVKAANENLTALASNIRAEHDLVVNHIVQIGDPIDQVSQWTSAYDIDLIVMGTQGLSRLHTFFMGSTAYGVIRRLAVPVLTVPEHVHGSDFRKILFPVRLIPNALEKYDVLRPIIKQNQCELIVAGVMTSNNPENQDGMEVLLRNMRIKLLEDDVGFYSELHICDDIGGQVLALAKLENPDLIVITSTFDHALCGPSAGTYVQEIVQHARYPVLSVPAHSDEC